LARKLPPHPVQATVAGHLAIAYDLSLAHTFTLEVAAPRAQSPFLVTIEQFLASWDHLVESLARS